MDCARKEGIKYFRILSREELVSVLAYKADTKFPVLNQAEIDKITTAAKERWQKGWGSKGKKTETPVAEEAVVA